MAGPNSSGNQPNAHRTFCWNADFFALLQARWNSGSVEPLLDVGCGSGAWSTCLTPVLPNLQELVGAGADPRWIEDCRANLAFDDSVLEARRGTRPESGQLARYSFTAWIRRRASSKRCHALLTPTPGRQAER